MDKILITGASKGIGKATAELFIKNGYEVVAPSHQELDLASEESVKAYIDKNKDLKLFGIINNAGINEIGELDGISEKDIDKMLMVNLISPIKLLKGMIPCLKANGEGRIVNIGSIWAVVSKVGRSIYSATKNGMHGITNALAIELASHNILVNTVCPGFTLTELTRKNNTPEQIAKIASDIPLQRMAEPFEIANLVYFLGSRENSYITGQKITIDGGYTIK